MLRPSRGLARPAVLAFALCAAGALAVAAPLGAPASALALAEDANAKLAKERFLEGREAFKQKDYARALALFEESQKLVPAAGTMINLALCEAALGRNVAALGHFQKLAQELPANDPRREIVDEQLAALSKKVATLRIDLAPDAPKGASVALDGAAHDGRLGTDMLIEPGAHAVVVTAPDRAPRRYSVDAIGGKQTVLVVDVGAAATAASATVTATAAPVTTAPSTSSLQIAGFVVGGAGIVGIGVGVALGVLAIQKKDEVAKLCPVPSQCTEEGVAIEGTGKAFADGSTAAVIGGVVLAGAGATMVVLGRRATSTSVTAPAIAVVPRAGGVTILATGRF